MQNNKVAFWKLIIIFVLIVSFLDMLHSLIRHHLNFSEYFQIFESTYLGLVFESVLIFICGAFTFLFGFSQAEVTIKFIYLRMVIYVLSYIIISTILILATKTFLKEPFTYNLFDDSLKFLSYSTYQAAFFNLTWIALNSTQKTKD